MTRHLPKYRLLKESLGGNSKTIMIAALSPADINYTYTYTHTFTCVKNIENTACDLDEVAFIAVDATVRDLLP